MADGSIEINAAASGKLKSLVERAERLIEDRAVVSADLKELFSEAGAEGFDTKIIRKVIKIRAADKAKLSEEEALTDLYLAQVGA